MLIQLAFRFFQLSISTLATPPHTHINKAIIESVNNCPKNIVYEFYYKKLYLKIILVNQICNESIIT